MTERVIILNIDTIKNMNNWRFAECFPVSRFRYKCRYLLEGAEAGGGSTFPVPLRPKAGDFLGRRPRRCRYICRFLPSSTSTGFTRWSTGSIAPATGLSGQKTLQFQHFSGRKLGLKRSLKQFELQGANCGEHDGRARIQPSIRVVGVSGSILQSSDGNPPQFGQLVGQNLLSGFIIPGQTWRQRQPSVPDRGYSCISENHNMR